MLIIEYDLFSGKGTAYSDLEAERVVLNTYLNRYPGRDDHLCVSTANVIEAAACLLKEGSIPAGANIVIKWLAHTTHHNGPLGFATTLSAGKSVRDEATGSI